jgi:hypothetical protein
MDPRTASALRVIRQTIRDIPVHRLVCFIPRVMRLGHGRRITQIRTELVAVKQPQMAVQPRRRIRRKANPKYPKLSPRARSLLGSSRHLSGLLIWQTPPANAGQPLSAASHASDERRSKSRHRPRTSHTRDSRTRSPLEPKADWVAAGNSVLAHGMGPLYPECHCGACRASACAVFRRAHPLVLCLCLIE